MKENKKTASSAATLEAECGLNNISLPVYPSRSNYNITSQNGNKNQIIISELLPKGEENAIPARELAKMTGVSDARTLRAIITREREAGELILSTTRRGGGYFMPDDGEKGKREIDAFIHTQYARAFTTFRISKAAVHELDKIDGQTSIEEAFD